MFGRNLSIGIGFSFNNKHLNRTRARVARYMQLGLEADIPDRVDTGRQAEAAPVRLNQNPTGIETTDNVIDNDLGNINPESLEEITCCLVRLS